MLARHVIRRRVPFSTVKEDFVSYYLTPLSDTLSHSLSRFPTLRLPMRYAYPCVLFDQDSTVLAPTRPNREVSIQELDGTLFQLKQPRLCHAMLNSQPAWFEDFAILDPHVSA